MKNEELAALVRTLCYARLLANEVMRHLRRLKILHSSFKFSFFIPHSNKLQFGFEHS